MKKAFLVGYGAGHANILAPIHQQLLREKKIQSTALALSVAKNTFQQFSLPFKTIRDYADVLMDARAERYGTQLADRWHVESSGLTREESVIYLGVSMRDLVDTVGEERAWQLLEKDGRQCFLPTPSMETIIRAERPDMIITTNSPRMERAATLTGNRLGISTLNIHDDMGFYARDYKLTGDQIAVMSEITKDNLVEQGYHAENMIVTGHPAFDSVPEELRRYDRQEIIKKLSLPGNGPYLLLGTSQPGERGRIAESCPLVVDAVVRMGKYHLIIKPHPGEDAQAYRDYAKPYKDYVSVVSHINIRDVLILSEMLIAFASTIMIEALLMKRPVISLNLSGKPDPLPFVRWGLGMEASHSEGLQSAIQRISQDIPFHKQFNDAQQRYFAHLVDGHATERIVKLIYRMAAID